MLPKFYFPQACIGGDLEKAAPYWDNPNYCAQAKLDGARYLIHKDLKGKVRIYSRQISKQTGHPVLKTEQLQHLAKEFDKIAPAGTVIDGEVVATGLSSSNLVTRVTGSKPDRALQVQQEHGFLLFKAFDLLALNGADITTSKFCARDAWLHDLLEGHAGHIHKLGIHFGKDKRDLYNRIVAEGGEGIILKDLNSPYFQGERHKSFVKVKVQRTFDVVILGFQEAEEFTVKKGDEEATKSRIAGKVGAIKYGLYVQSNQIEVVNFGLFKEVAETVTCELKEIGTVSGFDDKTRDEFTAHPDKYIGTVIEVIAQEQFSSGSLRHPRFLKFRPDKNSEDCILHNDEG